MSKIRDITKFLSLTAAENPTNQPLASTGDAALDSAEALALITGGNAITVTSGVVNHNDTSSQASVNNSGSNFIQDITLDTYGHVTAITSAEAAGGGDPYVNVNSTAAAATASGTDGIAVGGLTYALGSNTVSIGKQAGQYTGTSTGNSIFIGFSAGATSNASSEVCVGYFAGAHGYQTTNTRARYNSVNIGPFAGRYSGNSREISIGEQAGASDNQDAYNIARFNNVNANINIGYWAGYKAVNTYENVRIGPNAGYNYGSSTITYTNSYGNVIIGGYAGQHGASQTNVYGNVTIGRQAGTGRENGYENVEIGAGAGNGAEGYHCIYIGAGSAPAGIGNTVQWENVIGAQLTGKGGNTLYTRGQPYNSFNQSSWSTTSDERVKTNITDYTLGLDALGQVNVKTFNYRSDSDIATNSPELADSDGLVHEGLDTEKTDIGIIAQELELILPNTVTIRDNGMKSVNKDELFWVMLNSIKELKARVEALENA
jgi:trimeric autotransporter adhesin